MTQITVHHRSPLPNTYRAARVSSLFNVEGDADFKISLEAPLMDRPWQIGLIKGPSGSGKSSIARALFGARRLKCANRWPGKGAIVDEITPGGSFDAVTAALSAVGLGSVPSWLRPYAALSTGEKFRADLARVLCERPGLFVMGQMLARIEAMLKASSSFEEFREMLLASSDDIDAAELEAVLASAMLAGETGGRAMIEGEADG